MIEVPTVSDADDTKIDLAGYGRLKALLAEDYPALHRALRVEQLGKFALLYTWSGSEPDLPAVAFLAHWDVVPVESGTENEWTHPPFSGFVDEEFVWGRGALDDKISIATILEAVETLVTEGFSPHRTIYLCFGGDEEISGARGAGTLSRTLEERGIRLEYVLDEGAVIMDGALPDIARPIALVGIAEKGHVNVRLSVHHEGGHASMPPQQSAAGIIGRAVHRLERSPFPPRLIFPVRQFLKAIAPEATWLQGVLFRWPWLARRAILRAFSQNLSTNALVRTTQAVTMLRGSDAPNVLPQNAEAIVNVRILPGDTVAGVVSRFRKIIRDDRISVTLLTDSDSSEPVPQSSVASAGFRLLEEAIADIFPEAVCAPFLVTGSTDSKFYQKLTDSIFRFTPITLGPRDVKRVHSTDERVSHVNAARAVEFYRHLIQRSAVNR